MQERLKNIKYRFCFVSKKVFGRSKYMVKSNSIKLPAQDSITFDIKYVDLQSEEIDRTNDSHVHPECEIYINLSGDVSFMVEKRIYPITPGSIIVTRPYEYHHCIYHTDKPHRHFWILFSAPTDSEATKFELYKKFFARDLGSANLLALQKESRDKLITLCHTLTCDDLSLPQKYAGFFDLIKLIDEAQIASDEKNDSPEEIDTALAFIDHSFTNSAVTVADIAGAAGVSINTLERHFRNTLSISPGAYLKKKRLAHAAELLFLGKTVSEACDDSGFSDYSHFISLFKSSYGITPLKYKKIINDKNI